MTEKFVIDHDHYCEYCGCPLYRYDTAYYCEDTDGVYCCEECAFTHEADNRYPYDPLGSVVNTDYS